MTKTVTLRKVWTLLWCKDLIIMLLYSATKILETGVQLQGKQNTKINNNSKMVGAEQFFVWIVAKFCFKCQVNLSVLVIFYHPMKMSKSKGLPSFSREISSQLIHLINLLLQYRSVRNDKSTFHSSTNVSAYRSFWRVISTALMLGSFQR